MGPEVGHSCAGDVNVSETLNALFSAWPNPLPPAEGVAPVPTWVGLEDRPPPPPPTSPPRIGPTPVSVGRPKGTGNRKEVAVPVLWGSSNSRDAGGGLSAAGAWLSANHAEEVLCGFFCFSSSSCAAPAVPGEGQHGDTKVAAPGPCFHGAPSGEEGWPRMPSVRSPVRLQGQTGAPGPGVAAYGPRRSRRAPQS